PVAGLARRAPPRQPPTPPAPRPWPRSPCAGGEGRLRDPDLLAEVDVLDEVEQLHSLVHRPLEGLASRDEPHPARPLVHHRGLRRLREVVLPRGPPRVDEPRPTHVAV